MRGLLKQLHCFPDNVHHMMDESNTFAGSDFAGIPYDHSRLAMTGPGVAEPVIRQQSRHNIPIWMSMIHAQSAVFHSRVCTKVPGLSPLAQGNPLLLLLYPLSHSP